MNDPVECTRLVISSLLKFYHTDIHPIPVYPHPLSPSITIFFFQTNVPSNAFLLFKLEQEESIRWNVCLEEKDGDTGRQGMRIDWNGMDIGVIKFKQGRNHKASTLYRVIHELFLYSMLIC